MLRGALFASCLCCWQRLIELREAERHAAHAMAHHAAAMERARVDSQRVQLELVRATAEQVCSLEQFIAQ